MSGVVLGIVIGGTLLFLAALVLTVYFVNALRFSNAPRPQNVTQLPSLKYWNEMYATAMETNNGRIPTEDSEFGRLWRKVWDENQTHMSKNYQNAMRAMKPMPANKK